MQPPGPARSDWHTVFMKPSNSIEDFLELCKEVADRMERDGTWPWAGSPNFEDLVESEDNPKNL